jgi:NAD(P)-dependent dehydrogenase (short-subunit alcohol dehydrogenase family)
LHTVGISALVSGAASGLGLANATRLIESGADVVMVDLPGSDGTGLAERLRDVAHFVPAEVTDSQWREHPRAEIEDVLVEHPHVRDCAVVGVEDPEWGQIIVAVVVLHTGASPDPDALREHVRGQLRGSRTPDRVVFRDELPTNATGKVLRRQLVDELNSSSKEPA